MRLAFGIPAVLAAALGLSGCVGGFGYGGISAGYGDRYDDPYYDDPYNDDRYYAASYYGWYDDYYYPGIGFYIYDGGGSRHRWNDRHRHYWEGRRGSWEGRRGSHQARENWSGYRRDGGRERGWEGRGEHTRDGDHRRDRRWERRGGDAGGAIGAGNTPDRSWRDRDGSGQGMGQGIGQGSGAAPISRGDPGQGGQMRAAPRTDQAEMRPEPRAEPRAETRVEQRSAEPRYDPPPARVEVQRAEPVNTNVRDD